ncbi:hypothetical protein BH24ACT19_BH24ACT19_08880 [soil metagenome]
MCGETEDHYRPCEDEYVLDTPTIRSFVSGVRETIAWSGDPAEAVESLRPLFSGLLAGEGWLPEEYQSPAPESGMGGGIGQWLLFRSAARDLCLFALVVPTGAATPRPRSPRLEPGRSLQGRAGGDRLRPPRRGDAGRRERSSLRKAAPHRAAGRRLSPTAAGRRRSPRPHDLLRDLRLRTPARQRHRLRLAPLLRPRDRRRLPPSAAATSTSPADQATSQVPSPRPANGPGSGSPRDGRRGLRTSPRRSGPGALASPA